jgi:hypothetical protein
LKVQLSITDKHTLFWSLRWWMVGRTGS